MFNIGDMVFYGGHGVCEIEDITEMTVSKETKQYYRLKSHVQPKLQLFHPVVTKLPKISKMMSKEAAENVLEIFKQEPTEWVARSIDRTKAHKKVLETKEQVQIAQMLNTILRKEVELKAEGKKLYAQDQEIVRQILPILCDEISISIGQTKEQVMEQIISNMQK